MSGLLTAGGALSGSIGGALLGGKVKQRKQVSAYVNTLNNERKAQGIDRFLQPADKHNMGSSSFVVMPDDWQPEKAAAMRFKLAAESIAPDVQRYNDYIEQHVIPHDDAARWAAHLVANNTAKSAPTKGMGLGALLGGAAGGVGALALRANPSEALLLGTAGAGIGALGGGIAGKGKQRSEQDKAYLNTLINQRSAHGISDFIRGADKNSTTFNPNAKVPDDWQPEKAASMRFSLAMHKLAFGEEAGDMSSPGAPDAAPGGQFQPTNYLAAEMAGQQAQQMNEASFYRNQLGANQQQMTSLQQQLMDAQGQLQQLQQQASDTGMQVQQAAQEAMAARDDAVNATLEVAKARIGAQRMRQAMLDLASQDPQAMGEEAMAPQMDPTMDPEADPTMGQGPAGMAPDQPTAPGSAPADGQEDMNANAASAPGPSGGEVMPQVKMGGAGAVLGGIAGAGLGALGARQFGQSAPALRDRVQQLEGEPGGTFAHAAALAKAKQGLAGAELAQQYPGRAMLSGAVAGGVGGVGLGAGIQSHGSELMQHLGTLGRAALGRG